jgi:hypothetical protein
VKEFPTSLNRDSSAFYHSQKSFPSGLLDNRKLFDSTSSEFLADSGAKGRDLLEMSFFDCFAEIFLSLLVSNQPSRYSESTSVAVKCSQTNNSKEQGLKEEGITEVNSRGLERVLFNFSIQTSSTSGDGFTKFTIQNDVAANLKGLLSELASLQKSKLSSVLDGAKESELMSFITLPTALAEAQHYQFEDTRQYEPTNQPDNLSPFIKNHSDIAEAQDILLFTDYQASSHKSLREDLIEALKREERLVLQKTTLEHQPSRFKIESKQFNDIKSEEGNILELSQIHLSVKSYQRSSQSENEHSNSLKNVTLGLNQENSSHPIFENSSYDDADNFQRGQNQHQDLSTEGGGFGTSYDAVIFDSETNEFLSSSSQTQNSFIQLLKDKIVDLAKSDQGRIFVSLEIFDEPLSLVILSNKGELRFNFRTKSSSIESKLLGVSNSLKAYLKSKGFIVSEFVVNDTVAFRYEEKISLSNLDHFLQETELE